VLTRPRYNVCVFGGAYPGDDPIYTDVARDLGARLAEHKFGLVYGGAVVGVMGALADGCLAASGYVEGVIPEALLPYEIAHPSLSQLTVVDGLDARKRRMMERADAFVTLPGGFGTLDETFEVITAAQLAQHRKPVAILNVNGFFDALMAWIHRSHDAQFIAQRDIGLLQVFVGIDSLMGYLSDTLRANVTPAPARSEREVAIAHDVRTLRRHTARSKS